MRSSPLVDPSAPVALERRDGRVFVQLPSRDEAEQIVHRVKRRLSDLPVVPDTSNPIACVVAYELFGLQVDDIAVAMGINVTQVNTIKQHEAFKTLKKQILENIQEAGREEVTDLFKSKRQQAASKIVELVDNPRPQVALRASERVLEASGYALSPQKKSDHDPMKTGLTIVYIDGDKPTREIPTIELRTDTS